MPDTFNVTNPATGEVLATITRNSEEEIKKKIQQSHEAFLIWKKTTAHERSKLLSQSLFKKTKKKLLRS